MSAPLAKDQKVHVDFQMPLTSEARPDPDRAIVCTVVRLHGQKHVEVLLGEGKRKTLLTVQSARIVEVWQ